MSYKLFDQGLSSQEVKTYKQTHKAEEYAMEQLRKWKESERVLNILRPIKASIEAYNKFEMETWLKLTKRR